MVLQLPKAVKPQLKAPCGGSGNPGSFRALAPEAVAASMTVKLSPLLPPPQLWRKLARLASNFVVVFIPWEMRIKKIESKCWHPEGWRGAVPGAS